MIRRWHYWLLVQDMRRDWQSGLFFLRKLGWTEFLAPLNTACGGLLFLPWVSMFDPMIFITPCRKLLVNLHPTLHLWRILSPIHPFLFKCFMFRSTPKRIVSKRLWLAMISHGPKNPTLKTLKVHGTFQVGNFFKKLSQGVVALIAC